MLAHDHDHDPHEVTLETLTTPPIHIDPAPLGRRAGAGLIDSLVITATWSILAVAIHQNLALLTQNYFLLSSLAVSAFLYYLILEWITSSTVGKSLFKLTVVDKDGDPCSFEISMKRSLFRFIDWLPALYIVGAVTVLTSSQRRRLGDRVAGSVVTSARAKDSNPPPAPFLFH
jgi:uncharacterized RDD family membrane protein YckC